jgi:thiamine-phosphate pyrophosphorylase
MNFVNKLVTMKITQMKNQQLLKKLNVLKKLKLLFPKKRFTILGSAHNQLEYYFKKRQSCQLIFLSPIFKTNKYSINKILGLLKFKLLSLNWDIKTAALGGIKNTNIKLTKLIKGNSVGFKSLINEL